MATTDFKCLYSILGSVFLCCRNVRRLCLVALDSINNCFWKNLTVCLCNCPTQSFLTKMVPNKKTAGQHIKSILKCYNLLRYAWWNSSEFRVLSTALEDTNESHVSMPASENSWCLVSHASLENLSRDLK